MSERRTARTTIVSLLVLASVAAPLPYLLRFDHDHSLTALLLVLTIAAIAFYSRQAALAATMVLLAMLGDYRRYAGFFAGFPVNDALLLVGPAVACLLLGQAMLRSRPPGPTTLSRLVLALALLMFIEMFNPAQGGLQVGITGALFYLAPLLWFWVGRAMGSVERAEFITFRVVVMIGVAAALLGLYQTYAGLLPFEQRWVNQVGYGALYISDDVIRAIGFFNSSAEYQRYLIAASIVTVAAWVTNRSRMILLLPLFMLAVFLAAARGPVLMFLGASVIVWSVAGRRASWTWRLLIAGVGGFGLLVAALLLLQSSAFGSRIAPLVSRQVEGLLDPANQEKSTASGHLQMVKDGLIAGLANPAGYGLGATTIAAQKYGSQTLNAEVDVANVMISVGVIGGVLYTMIVFVVLRRAAQWWRNERQPYALAAGGILVVTLGGWLIGGEYSMAALVWLQIGMIDRLARRASPVGQRSGVHALGNSHP